MVPTSSEVAMARMYPDPISADTKSIAERMLYNCLQEQLDHTFVAQR